MTTPRILVDADACPVKSEIYRVAARERLKVTLVANAPIRLPAECEAELIVVGSGFDAADDKIAEIADETAIVITADIPLADRCLKKGATAIGPTGRPFTPDSIGGALAARALSADLREMARGDATLHPGSGPRPLGPADRSRFLQSLDQAIQSLRRGRRPFTR